MTEASSKFRTALKRIQTHADDDHEGEVRENVLDIFDKLSKQEKLAILEDVVDTHMGEDQMESDKSDTMRAELEIMRTKDEIKRNRQGKIIIFTCIVLAMVIFFAYAAIAAVTITDGNVKAEYFKSIVELLTVLFGLI